MDSQSCSLHILVLKKEEQVTNDDYDVQVEPVHDTVIGSGPRGLQ